MVSIEKAVAAQVQPRPSVMCVGKTAMDGQLLI